MNLHIRMVVVAGFLCSATSLYGCRTTTGSGEKAVSFENAEVMSLQEWCGWRIGTSVGLPVLEFQEMKHHIFLISHHQRLV